MSESLSKPLNETFKQSVDPVNSRPTGERTSLNEVMTESVVSVSAQQTTNISFKKSKILTGFGIFFMLLGLIMFLVLSPLIQSQIVKQAIDQAILSPDNENFWAHFPGESETIITRNFSFFNFVNEENFFLYGQKPKFRQAQGYIVTELQDYLNITYNEDMSMVKMKDWLRFDINQDSRSLEQKQRILNVPSLGYWFLLKNSRDALVFIEGFSLLFTSIQNSIIDIVTGQGISAQFIHDQTTAYLQLFQPAGISVANSKFLWWDVAYGFSDKNNLQYWVQAAKNSFTSSQASFSKEALNLKDYFTLSDSELYFILSEVSEYAGGITDLVINNYYCEGIPNCDGRQLAIRQIASSYVTFSTPPVSSITAAITICTDNQTCAGYYPELYSYYKQVYLVEHPTASPLMVFDVEMVRKWLDYNPTRQEGVYNKKQSALLHIGNLDALFSNGTMHDRVKKDHFQATEFLVNIKERFELPDDEQTRVFWEWIKYLCSHLLRQKSEGNQKLGIANAFSNGLYDSFTYLQDNIQNYMLKTMLKNRLRDQNCDTLISDSLQTNNPATVQAVCNHYSHDIQSEAFVQESIQVCRNKYQPTWVSFQNLGVSNLQMESFCDKNVKNSFGELYHNMRKELNDFYACDQTPNEYCSDYELALKQWVNSTVTLNQPVSAGNSLKSSTTFASWDAKAPVFQYYHYTLKFPGKEFPTFDMEQLYKLFNFNEMFSATANLRRWLDPATPIQLKDYIRYIVVFVTLKGFTNQRTAREYMFGYNDEYLLFRKNNYPPFGGDPSTPAYTAFNDLNITRDEATLELEWHTGKANSTMTAQYYKINGYTYLTTNYTRFNGNQTYWVLESPWAEKDYFYGTSGKSFAPDQPNSQNVSIYVPNLQRYGSGNLGAAEAYSKYGYDLNLAYLGDYIYQNSDVYPDNKKYYQTYYAVFNETSVLGFPFYFTKHHFMNCSENWTNAVEIYNEDETIRYTSASHWDDSYVIVQPYSGVSFQSVLFIQGNYLYEPDELFTINQTIMMPVMGIYRSGNLTETKANELFELLVTALSVKTAILYVGIVVALMGTGGFAYGFTNVRKAKRQINERNESIKISMQPQKPKKSTKSNHLNAEDSSQGSFKEDLKQSGNEEMAQQNGLRSES